MRFIDLQTGKPANRTGSDPSPQEQALAYHRAHSPLPTIPEPEPVTLQQRVEHLEQQVARLSRQVADLSSQVWR